MRYKTKPWDSPEMRGYPSYCVWDTELDEMASEKGLLLVFSSVTGEIACADANKKTQELNSRTSTFEKEELDAEHSRRIRTSLRAEEKACWDREAEF